VCSVCVGESGSTTPTQSSSWSEFDRKEQDKRRYLHGSGPIASSPASQGVLVLVFSGGDKPAAGDLDKAGDISEANRRG